MKLANLRVCNIQNPVGYAMDAPVFSWTVEDAAGEQAWASVTVRCGGAVICESGETPDAAATKARTVWRLSCPAAKAAPGSRRR